MNTKKKSHFFLSCRCRGVVQHIHVIYKCVLHHSGQCPEGLGRRGRLRGLRGEGCKHEMEEESLMYICIVCYIATSIQWQDPHNYERSHAAPAQNIQNIWRRSRYIHIHPQSDNKKTDILYICCLLNPLTWTDRYTNGFEHESIDINNVNVRAHSVVACPERTFQYLDVCECCDVDFVETMGWPSGWHYNQTCALC